MVRFSQVSEGLTLGLNGRELKPSGKSKLTSIAAECSQSISQEPTDLRTSETVAAIKVAMKISAERDSRFLGLTSSAEDSIARTSVMPESKQGLTASAAAEPGEKCIGSFSRWDRASLSWKTWQLC